MCLLLGYFAMLSIVALVVAISAWFKTAFATIILCSALFVLPLFIQQSNTSRLINYLVTTFPLKVINGYKILQSYTLFNFFLEAMYSQFLSIL